MTRDNNKKITEITYNILNLPSIISVSNGSIKYYYDANGKKLQKRTIENINPSKNTSIVYIGDAVYENDTLQFLGFSENRVRSNLDRTGWVYDYFLKDHLGSTRMMITDNDNVTSPILEANSYYPFGLQQKEIGPVAYNSLHNCENKVTNAIELEGLESRLINLYNASQKKNVQDYSQAANSAWTNAASFKVNVAVKGLGIGPGVGIADPQASLTYSSGGKITVDGSVASGGGELSGSIGSLSTGVGVENALYSAGNISTSMYEVRGEAELGPSKTVKDQTLSGTGSANVLDNTLSVRGNFGVVGFQVSVNIYKTGKAVANTFLTLFIIVGNYINETLKDITDPKRNVPKN